MPERLSPGRPVPKPEPRAKRLPSPPKRRTVLATKGSHPAKQERRRSRAEAKALVKEDWPSCVWPGCRRPGVEAAHAYGTGPQPGQHDDPLNLWPMCSKHHRTGLVNCTYTPEMVRALQDLTDERRLLVAHGEALPERRIRERFYEAFGEILRRTPPHRLARYCRYLGVEEERVRRELGQALGEGGNQGTGRRKQQSQAG